MNNDTFNKMTFGFCGSKLISGATSGRFCAFTVIDATSVSWTLGTASDAPSGGDSSFTSIAVPAGTTIYGNIKSITPSGGDVVAYLYDPSVSNS